MLQKLPTDGFKQVQNTSQFEKDFIENCNEDSDYGHFLEVDIQDPGKVHDLSNYFAKEFKLKKMKNLQLTCMIKKEYVIHIRNLKQALNYGQILKKVQRINKLFQETWLKYYININAELRKNANKL